MNMFKLLVIVAVLVYGMSAGKGGSSKGGSGRGNSRPVRASTSNYVSSGDSRSTYSSASGSYTKSDKGDYAVDDANKRGRRGKGNKGSKGNYGNNGNNGNKGNKGNYGNKGNKGSKGYKGNNNKGNKGNRGNYGNNGNNGDYGNKGNKNKGNKGDYTVDIDQYDLGLEFDEFYDLQRSFAICQNDYNGNCIDFKDEYLSLFAADCDICIPQNDKVENPVCYNTLEYQSSLDSIYGEMQEISEWSHQIMDIQVFETEVGNNYGQYTQEEIEKIYTIKVTLNKKYIKGLCEV